MIFFCLILTYILRTPPVSTIPKLRMPSDSGHHRGYSASEQATPRADWERRSRAPSCCGLHCTCWSSHHPVTLGGGGVWRQMGLHWGPALCGAPFGGRKILAEWIHDHQTRLSHSAWYIKYRRPQSGCADPTLVCAESTGEQLTGLRISIDRAAPPSPGKFRRSRLLRLCSRALGSWWRSHLRLGTVRKAREERRKRRGRKEMGGPA